MNKKLPQKVIKIVLLLIEYGKQIFNELNL